MSYLSNKISGLTTLSNFTAKVIQDNSPKRYANTTFKSTTFTVGVEYTGINFYKGSNRPPKLRILSVFRPLINGNPNANNDTYVAFSVYDYALGRFRGPLCRRSQLDSQLVYNDFYVTTIDKFGKNYGNVFTSDSGSSTAAFSAPSASFASTLNTTIGGINLTITAGHYTGCFTFAGPNNTTIDFNGFFRLSGLSGSYCFYTLADNGTVKTFRNTRESSQYTNNTYPYLTPVTNKYASEWRCSPICSLDDAGYTPLVRPNQVGPIKYKAYADNPSFDFLNNIGVFPTDVWVQSDDSYYPNFFGRPLFADGGGEQGAGGYAPAGYYGVSTATVYDYWNGSGWSGNITDYSGGGGGGFNGIEYRFLGPYFDPNMACSEDGRAEFFQGFIDGDLYSQPDFGSGVFDDSTGTNPIGWAPAGMWFKVFDSGYNSLGYSVTFDDSMVISGSFRCR